MELDVKDFRLPQDLERYRKAVRELVQTELERLSGEIEETNAMPSRLMPLLRKSGLLILRLPPEWGGFGLNLSQFWPIQSETARSHGAIRTVVRSSGNKWVPIFRHGTEAQKKKYLPFLTRGEYAGFALTEPDSGTGVDIRSTAVRAGDSYVLNGTKHLTTLANVAVFFHVVAYTGDRSLGARGISVLLVEPGTPGLEIESMGDKLGLRGVFHGRLKFRDCRIPAENLLGREGEGLEIAMGSYLDPNVFGCAVDFLGACERMLELSAQRARTRVTFGKPIGDRQAVRQTLADMAVDVYALRCMLGECARKFDRGESIAVDAAKCKLFGFEASRRVSDQALLIHGGVGYTKALPIERIYRDVRSLWFEEGTPTIQRLVVSREVLTEAEQQAGTG